jgi:hypothetical protein
MSDYVSCSSQEWPFDLDAESTIDPALLGLPTDSDGIPG